jgi:hypothetical protein
LGQLDAQLTVWSDGNAELDLTDLDNMEHRVEHRQMDSFDDVANAVAMAVEWMTRNSSV